MKNILYEKYEISNSDSDILPNILTCKVLKQHHTSDSLSNEITRYEDLFSNDVLKEKQITEIYENVLEIRNNLISCLPVANTGPMQSIYCHTPNNNNVTQTQHSCWVGHENDYANPTTPPHPPTTETQQRPLTASEQHSLITNKYSVISNNKQGHNNNNKDNNINNKIISFRSLRLTFIDSNYI